jgi:Zn-dependent protease with chaperone function
VKYEHREIPEGINVTQVHPLRELAVLLGGAAIIIVALVFALSLSAGQLARHIPFDLERDLSSFAVEPGDNSEIEAYLEQVKTKVIEHMELPEGMTIHLHYSDDDTLNAFATLGGHIVLFRGLLEKLPNENSLAMLLAHEIAHVKHRDPIVSVTRGMTVSAVLGLLFGFSELDVLGNAGLYTMLHFSREMESEADKAALAAVHGIYGHTRGADDLFHIIQAYRKEQGESEGLEFLQTHPLDQNRIDAAGAQARKNLWSGDGETTPIPAGFLAALSADGSEVKD